MSEGAMATMERNEPDPMDDDEISLIDLLQVVADNLRLLVLGPLAAGLVALAVSFAIPPTFTATTTFLPPQQQQSAAAAMLQSFGALTGAAGVAAGIKNPVDQYVAFVHSQGVQDALIDRFKLLDRYDEKYRQDARKALDKHSRITGGVKDGIITVEVDDKDPTFAAALANGYVEELHRLLGRLAVTEAQQRRVFFEHELAESKTALIKAEQALKASGLNSGAIKASPQAAVEALAKLKAAVTAQEVKVASMRGYLADTAPDFRQALTELAALRAQLSRAERDDPGAEGARGESDYVAKFREYKYQETLFDLFSKQYEAARVDESREGAVIQVLDAATPPEHKSKPKRALIAVVTTLATGFVLLLWVFAQRAIRNANEDEESAQKLQRLRQALAAAVGR
jgi:uncharacterized protein involved in exopolysaccharide biosynthesis